MSIWETSETKAGSICTYIKRPVRRREGAQSSWEALRKMAKAAEGQTAVEGEQKPEEQRANEQDGDTNEINVATGEQPVDPETIKDFPKGGIFPKFFDFCQSFK